MGNTLSTFRDKYYEYGVGKEIKERGLTIGVYKSPWLVDLVASYIMDKLSYIFVRTTKYSGIYRDDGIVIFDGKSTKIMDWLKTFQFRVDDLIKSKRLIFTAEI